MAFPPSLTAEAEGFDTGISSPAGIDKVSATEGTDNGAPQTYAG
jgi:hypothetical protein